MWMLRGYQPEKYFGDKALSVFVKVPSIEVLEKRLKHRKHGKHRIAFGIDCSKLSSKMSFQDKFDCVLLNEDLKVTAGSPAAVRRI